MSAIYLIARRDYLAYVGALGFWISLIAAPFLLLLIAFAPALLLHAEPARVVIVMADRAEDARAVGDAFARNARGDARNEIAAYVGAAAPGAAERALAAFDAAPDREAAIGAARAALARVTPDAARAFPNPTPRYIVAAPPAPDIEAVKPYVSGARKLVVAGAARGVFGALDIRREAGAPLVDYWSVNLTNDEPAGIASRALAALMKRETLAARGLDPALADELDKERPRVGHYDPRAHAGGEVTGRERAPFFVAVFLCFVLWSAVFGVAHMLLTGVVEEKSSKILDMLLTSASPLELLAGKLVGIAAVSATLFAVWGALGGVALSFAADRVPEGWVGQAAAAFLEPRLLVAFMIGFATGYLLYGALFVAIGSLCDSMQEAQSVMGPIAIVMMAPMLLMGPAIANPNASVIVGASWFPLFTPFLIMLRAPTNLSWAEIAGLGAMMAATIAIVLMLAARVFRAGVSGAVSIATLRQRLAPKKS
jgi:ABC-2 type transport system permease protein